MKPSRVLFTAWMLVGLLGASTQAQEGAIDELKACLGCHDSDDTMEFADGVEVSIQVDKVSYLAGAHGQLNCTDCHVGLDLFDHMDEERAAYVDYRVQKARQCEACHQGEGTEEHAAAPSIDRTLHPSLTEGTPLCTDCHDAHAAIAGDPARGQTSRACAQCHEKVFSTFAASAHGAGLRGENDPNVPVCTDCHGGHSEEGTTAIARQVRLGQPCMGCHGDQGLMSQYGLSSSVVSTYLSDFHGVSVKFYEEAGTDWKESPLVCADCHGVHEVAAVAGAEALMKDQLLQVCQRCHEEAPASFPDAWLSHYEPSLDKATLVYLVKVGYWILIPFVIIGLSIQILVDLVLYPRRRRKENARKKARGTKDPVFAATVPKEFQRFTVHQRVEHLLVMALFGVLLVTGLPQKFHDTDWAVRVIGWLGGIDMVRMLHRAAGIVFSFQVIVHLALAAGTVLRRKTGMSIVPVKKDFTDAIQNLRYYLGKGEKHPRFDRFDYRQKFEYWGMVLGSGIMIVSGLILYFPMVAATFLPGQFIPAAKAAHTYEAMMALLTIIIWHMYGAHFNAECFPIDKSIFTGRISRERLRRDHPLEYQRLTGEQEPVDGPRPPDAAQPTNGTPSPPKTPTPAGRGAPTVPPGADRLP